MKKGLVQASLSIARGAVTETWSIPGAGCPVRGSMI